MPEAGWCAECGAYSWLREDGGCVKGHPPSAISGVYETEPARDRLEEALHAAEQAAERAGEAMKEAWDEAKPSLKHAGAAAENAAVEFGEGLRRFAEAISERHPKATDPAPPPPSEVDETTTNGS
jgi:hypothetical protein